MPRLGRSESIVSNVTKLPVSVDRDSIVEVTFEIRFAGAQKPVDSLLLGILFSVFKEQFPTTEALPASQIPAILRMSQPILARQPTQALVGDHKRLLVGDTVVALSHIAPYPGWSKLQPLILRLAETLQGTGVIDRVERFSLKYMNVFQHGGNDLDLAPFKIKCELDGFKLRGPGFSLRSEIDQGQCVSVVELQPGVTATINSQGTNRSFTGTRFSVDTIWQAGFKDFWNELPQMLGIAHVTTKHVFFGLLEDKTINDMGPTWG